MNEAQYQEFKIRARKADIQSRLHRINPQRYPRPTYSYTMEEVMDAYTWRIKTIFECDDKFYDVIKRKLGR